MIYVGVHPASVRWAIDHVRAGAVEAGREAGQVEIAALCALHVSDDQEEAWEQCRWAPAACANHIAYALKWNPAHGMPEEMTRIVAARDAYDYYAGHLDSSAEHTARPDGRAGRRLRDRRAGGALPGEDPGAGGAGGRRGLDRIPEREVRADGASGAGDHSGARGDGGVKRVGVDVGGTFTDLILVDEEAGRITVDKVPSTPDDPARGVVDGVRALCEKAGVPLAEVDNLLHGTTVATNIVLTHTGAEVGMLTTHGFRDILHIARHKKPFNFSLQQELPWQSRPLVKRRHRLTVHERVTAPDGEVLTPLDEDEVREQVRRLRDARVEAVAVCLLHSYLNTEHERRIKEIVLEEFPDAYLSVSHEVLPLYREFERFSTVCLNAYVGPKVSRYVERFDEALRAAGFAHEVQLMQSAGGMATVASATQRPVNLLMSGPVAGLIGGIWAGKMAGYDSVVTLDIGGTSADIGVAAGGQLRMRHLLDTKVGDYQAMVPMVDIDTIGAGGGSIAYVDAGGVFRVGPQSAGADPGPACYGRGGEEPTSTDAQLLLGRLRPDRGLLGGEMQLDPELARASMETIATQMGLSTDEAALGALQIQKFGMAQAIELNSVRRGYDPREFSLVAAGGAGPLFACDIALELEIPRVIVPPHPGITSATGLLATDLQHEYVATERHALKTLDRERLAARFDELCAEAVAQLDADRVPEDRRLVRRLADCRYAGQGYEVQVRRPGGRDRRRLGRGAEGGIPRGARAGVRTPLRRRDRDRQRPGRRHRTDRGARLVRAGAGRRRPRRREDRRARGRLRRRRPRRAPSDAVLRPRAAARRRPDRGPGDHRAVRLDHGRPTRPRRRDRPLREHRHRLHRRRPRRARRAGDPDPDARDRRRLLGDRQGDVRRPLPDVVLVDHPGVRGPRCRHLRRRGQRARRVGLDADVHGCDAEDRQGRDRAPRRRHPRRRRHPPQRPLPGRDALARRRDRDSDLPRGRARRLLGRVGAPARHRRRLPGARGRPRRQLVGGEHLPRGEALGAGRPPGGALEAHPREHAHADVQPRRHRGDDRGLRAGEDALPGAAAPLRQGRGARRGPRLDRLLRAHAPAGDREGAGRRLRDGGRLAGRRRPQPRRAAARAR